MCIIGLGMDAPGLVSSKAVSSFYVIYLSSVGSLVLPFPPSGPF